jgi:hypothetical protein
MPPSRHDSLSSERVVPRRRLHRDPAQVGELRDAGLAAEAAHPAAFDAAERHLRFIVHRGRIDMADARKPARCRDPTPWLAWFLGCLQRAQDSALGALDSFVAKAAFWQRWSDVPMNERQIKLLNRLLDGFEGKLTGSKWATIAKCSPDTALRDINELLARGVLKKSASGGRSTSYELA